ncbi:MAG: hypothetical protein EOO25_11880 [Comamonadaceae bacterium]|nr:MAG: hypothetical protein EOO25_11880 [Comamonadaceae bacterium]
MAALAAFAAWRLKVQDQGRRIALLGSHLGKYQIEKNMEALTQGYLRALGETDPQRRAQVFALLRNTEDTLSAQFSRFAADLSRADAAATRVSRLPFYLPFATLLLPAAGFDLRQLVAVHARGIQDAVGNTGAPDKDRAFTLQAELLLMQHSCHWFCKSKFVASARMLARHQTAHAQLVAAVAPATRAAYCALVRPGE